MKTLGLNMRQLHVFVRVVEAGSVSRAAEVLGTSQPQVSRTIADIERKLGSQLFFRTPEGLELSPTGRVLHRFAQQTLSLLYETEASLGDQEGVPSCPLVAGVHPAVLPYAATGIRAFREEYPDLLTRVEVADGYAILDLVRRQRVALGVTVGSAAALSGNLRSYFLGEQPWALLTTEAVSEHDLDEIDLLLPPEESWERMVLEDRIELPSARSLIEARNVYAACALAHEGFAAFLPLHCARVGLVPHPAVAEFTLEVHAVRLTTGRYPVSSQAFVRLLSAMDMA
ncbi:MAG TPA: LysR family transcriptional regulator [Oceanithermus profundus]|uniref:LysR family transcriptional regulator n=1 Tax=Oceanithermus profundus TaxID=187137 RepID=A0A7C4ZGS5_9DEIN|nr:LysR family transcriptional regulator [Oceanithermus profundus]